MTQSDTSYFILVLYGLYETADIIYSKGDDRSSLEESKELRKMFHTDPKLQEMLHSHLSKNV